MKRAVVLTVIVLISVFMGCSKQSGELSQDKQCEVAYQTSFNHFQEGRFDQALLEIKKSVTVCPKVWKYWFLKAQLEYNMENLLAAEESANQCIKAKTNCSRCYDFLGVLYTEQNRWAEAEKNFMKALDNPDYRTPVVSIYNLGILFYKQAKYPRALEEFTKAGKIDPSWDKPFYYKGQTLLHLNRPADAVADFKQATVINKKNCDAWYGLVKSYIQIREYKKAQDAVQQACQNFEDSGKCCKGLQLLLR